MREARRVARDQPMVRSVNYKSEAGFGGAADGGYASGTAPVYSVNKNASTGGITSEEEKNHVIRVLEHESKVYRF